MYIIIEEQKDIYAFEGNLYFQLICDLICKVCGVNYSLES